jgi:cbb3-type cytochrome oxidase subunit 3
MTTDWGFEKLYADLGLMRMGFGILFALFLLLFVAVIVEEVFLGGRRRRQAERQARLRQDAAPRSGE